MRDIRICFSYKHIDEPWDGVNNFTRALHHSVLHTSGFDVVNDIHDDYDILFMNQLSVGRGHERGGDVYTMDEIRNALRDSKKKLVVRAVNLKRDSHNHNFPRYGLKYRKQDEATVALLNRADFVIFQSAFQKQFFDNFGYGGTNYAIIHNGAAPVFLTVRNDPKSLASHDDLVLSSSAMSVSPIKKQDIIAALSLIRGVRVIHAGAWPSGLPSSKVNMTGVLPHDALARVYETSHYVLHPAIKDHCPNSLIEGLCAGLPALFNPELGSGSELSGTFGIPIDINDLEGTVQKARGQYHQLATALSNNRTYYSIHRATQDYKDVFESLIKR